MMQNQENKKSILTRDELQENVHYYINEQGYWVFTALYHQLRGYCCENNCLHCPYKSAKSK